MRRTAFVFVFCGFLMSRGGAQAADAMNAIAERYMHLVLAMDSMIPIMSTRFTDRLSGRHKLRKKRSR